MLAISCGQNQIKQNKKETLNEFNKINYSDSIFRYRVNYDTVLSSNWKISYLVKNDSTKYKDIYLKVAKGKDSSIYFLERYLELRNYFIPIFSKENESFIFFEHGCATSCKAVMTFNKKTLRFQDFTQIIDYSEKTNQIVWLSNQILSDDKPFKVQVTDLLKQKDSTIGFNNLALGTIKDSYIDSVIFNKDNTIINCTLIDKNDYNRTREVKETKIIKL